MNVVVNSFAVKSLEALAELGMAVPGRSEEAKVLRQKAGAMREAMLRDMWDEEAKLWCDRKCAHSCGRTFHSQHYTLWLGLTREEDVLGAFQWLAAQGMVGSTYSASSLLYGLYARGSGIDHGLTGLELLTSCDEYSWCNMLRGGASTSWEHWIAEDGTHSHPWSTSPLGIIAEGLMGLRPISPGWATWAIRPAVGILGFATIQHPSGLKVDVKQQLGGGSRCFEVKVDRAGLTGGEGTGSVCVPSFGKEGIIVVNGERVQGREDQGYLCADQVDVPVFVRVRCASLSLKTK